MIKEQHESVPFSPPLREDFIEDLQTEQIFSAHTIHTVEVNLLGGNVVVLGKDQEEITVRIQWDQRGARAIPRAVQRGSVLFVHSMSPWSFLGQQRPYVVEIHVPRHTRVRVNVLFGTCYLEHLDNWTEARVLLGEIRGVVRMAHAWVGAGDIKLHGLSADANVGVGAGDVELNWTELPASAEIKAFCGIGDVALQRPAGEALPVSARVRSLLGDVRIV